LFNVRQWTLILKPITLRWNKTSEWWDKGKW